MKTSRTLLRDLRREFPRQTRVEISRNTNVSGVPCSLQMIITRKHQSSR